MNLASWIFFAIFSATLILGIICFIFKIKLVSKIAFLLFPFFFILFLDSVLIPHFPDSRRITILVSASILCCFLLNLISFFSKKEVSFFVNRILLSFSTFFLILIFYSSFLIFHYPDSILIVFSIIFALIFVILTFFSNQKSSKKIALNFILFFLNSTLFVISLISLLFDFSLYSVILFSGSFILTGTQILEFFIFKSDSKLQNENLKFLVSSLNDFSRMLISLSALFLQIL